MIPITELSSYRIGYRPGLSNFIYVTPATAFGNLNIGQDHVIRKPSKNTKKPTIRNFSTLKEAASPCVS
ncbi:hypothetical protein N7540_005196 [Penicillium herquei]|nr:hypothetical protein N7540_005196 [Penicillium herquei]